MENESNNSKYLSQKRSLAKNTVSIRLRLTKSTCGDVIEKLDSLGNKRTKYIVGLIREDINSGN